MKKIVALLVIGLAAGMLSLPGQAADKGYPSRSIEFVITYEPGGNTDILSRIYIEELKDILKVPVIPVNKPGAGGAIGTTYIMNAKPDGYTIGAVSAGAMVISPIVEARLPYKRSDLSIICQIVNFPFGIFVRADAPWKNLKELADYARANPGKIRGAVGGPTGAPALLLEAFKIQAGGLNIINIPSKGGASMATAILGGNTEICSDTVSAEASLLKAGRVRGLAVTDKFPGLPELPTFEEAGFPGISVPSWNAVIAPKGLPKNVMDKLVSTLEKAAKSPKVMERLNKQFINADFIGPDAFTKRLVQEDAVIREIVKKLGMIK